MKNKDNPGILDGADPVNKLQLPGAEPTEASPHNLPRLVVGIMLVLAAICIHLAIENRHLKVAIGEFDNEYIDFLNTKMPDGSLLASKIKPETIGIFKIRDSSAACAMIQ